MSEKIRLTGVGGDWWFNAPHGSSPGQKRYEWHWAEWEDEEKKIPKKDQPLVSNYIFYVDHGMVHTDPYPDHPPHLKVAVMFEPFVLGHDIYYKVCQYEKYGLIFTHDPYVRAMTSKAILTPSVSCYLWETDWEHYDKTKNISMLCSRKHHSAYHQMRVEIAKQIIPSPYVDCYGLGWNREGESYFNDRVTPLPGERLEAYDDYRFSIVLENQIVDGLFTEKLLHCFMTGTVPIYLGGSIFKDFDEKGIIRYRPGLDWSMFNENLYQKMWDSIRYNHRASEKYILEDLLIRGIENKGKEPFTCDGYTVSEVRDEAVTDVNVESLEDHVVQ